MEWSRLTDCVAENSDLTPAEKETSISFAKTDDTARVFTAEAGLMRRLLSHEHFEVDHVVPQNGMKVESIEEIDAPETTIVGVAGRVPVGCLKMRTSIRGSSGHANVVSY